MIRVLLCVLVILTPLRALWACGLADTLAQYQAQYPLNGVVLVAHGDRILLHQAYGFADAAQTVPLDPNASFAIGSVSKQFTAAAVLQLADQGRLNLQAPIATYLPATHRIWRGHAPAWARRVTVHHLLSHSSGIVDYLHVTPTVHFAELQAADAVPAIVQYSARRPLQFTPGSRFAYNNSGYVLLGVLVDTLSGASVMSYFDQVLFGPAHAFTSFIQTPAQELHRSGWPTLFGARPQRLEVARYVSGAILRPSATPVLVGSTAGAVVATAPDLWRWTRALHAGEIVAAPWLHRMLQPYYERLDIPGVVGYGYGMMLSRSSRNTPVYRHGGSLSGVRAELRYAAQEQITVVIVTNVSPADGGSRKNNPLARLARDLEDVAVACGTVWPSCRARVPHDTPWLVSEAALR